MVTFLVIGDAFLLVKLLEYYIRVTMLGFAFDFGAEKSHWGHQHLDSVTDIDDNLTLTLTLKVLTGQPNWPLVMQKIGILLYLLIWQNSSTLVSKISKKYRFNQKYQKVRFGEEKFLGFI